MELQQPIFSEYDLTVVMASLDQTKLNNTLWLNNFNLICFKVNNLEFVLCFSISVATEKPLGVSVFHMFWNMTYSKSHFYQAKW